MKRTTGDSWGLVGTVDGTKQVFPPGTTLYLPEDATLTLGTEEEAKAGLPLTTEQQLDAAKTLLVDMGVADVETAIAAKAKLAKPAPVKDPARLAVNEG